MKKEKTKIAIIGICFFLITVICWFKPQTQYSESERRLLATKPEISLDAVLNGEFVNEFESYVLDQFPVRDRFRTIKAVSEYFVFQKKDNNGIYLQNDYAAKIEYPLNENSVENATSKIKAIYERYLAETDSEIYFSMIPDKNFFLGEKGGYPVMDYDKMVQLMKNDLDFAEYIDITGALTIEDYYKTDTHWRQEEITDVAEKLLASMGNGNDLRTPDYSRVQAKDDFRGVYYGQSALPLKSEPLIYLTDPALETSSVYNFETGKTGSVYEAEKLQDKDPYDIFLSGAAALMTIENPQASTQKELIMFRDSFGSSLAPLLVDNYAKITLVDLRYVQSEYIGQLVDFTGQDVLFIYGSTMINNSYTFK